MKTKPQLAFSLLKREIVSGKIAPGSKLPSLPLLCKSMGVSKYALLAGLSELEKQGLILRREKVGIFAPGSTEEVDASPINIPQAQTRAERLASDLKDEICRGKYRIGDFLPIAKVLQYQYQSSPSIVRSALRNLEKDGVLQRKGRTFVVGSQQAGNPTQRKKALFLSDSASIVAMSSGTENATRQFIRSLTNTVYDLGMQMSQRTPSEGEEFQFPREDVLRNVNGVIGFFAEGVRINQYEGDRFHSFERFLQTTNRLVLPFVVFRRAPFSPAFLKATRRYRRFFPISTASFRPGAMVGRYLAMCGHTNVSFFSFSDEKWDRQRLEETKQGHKAILGGGSIVTPFAANHNTREFLERHTAREKDTYFSQFVEKNHNGFIFESTKPYWQAKTYVRDLLWQDRLHTIMPKFFEQALTNTECKAWVCSDPVVTMSALRFLGARRKRIPEGISLISIDDHNDLAMRGITAFSFQGERLGYLAAHCIAGDIPVKRKRNGLVDCSGRIIERGSVGRA